LRYLEGKSAFIPLWMIRPEM
jgi:hypothetical protein